MRKILRKTVSIILTVTILLSLCVTAFADNLPSVDSSHYITCYPLASSGKIYALNNSNRWIDASDECRITAINGSQVYVSYPTSNGRHSEWFSRNAFATCEINYANCPTIIASSAITTYKRASGSDQLGNLGIGDKCYVLTKMGSRTQLIYPVSNGRYKMGWVNSADIYSNEMYIYSYTIHTALDTNKVIDVYAGYSNDGTNIQIYSANNGGNQQFAFIPVGNYFAIVNTATGKAIDVTGGVSASQTNVELYTVNFTDAQLWQCYDAGNKSYYLKNKLGYYLDVAGACTNDETNLWVYEYNGTTAQKWKFKKVSATNDTLSWYEANVGNVIANISSYTTNLDGYQGIAGQCVWYVRNRGYEKLGNAGLTGISGNANAWYTTAQNKGLSTGSTPRSNSIACWNGGSYGHVAYVEYYDSATETVYFTEANWGGKSSTNGQLKKLSLSEFKSRKSGYKGCIYLQ